MKGGQQNAIRSESVYHDYSGNFSNSGKWLYVKALRKYTKSEPVRKEN